MEEIINITGHKPYEIIIATNTIEKLAEYLQTKNYSKVLLLTESKIDLPFNLPTIDITHKIGGGEKIKNINSITNIWNKFLAEKLDRKSLVIAVGGGALLDAVGFATSTYMRGIDVINIPTTLLSQVDASIGGKTGINLEHTKNIIGTFNNPKKVYIDTTFLSTLNLRELNSGYAEMIKHGLIASKQHLDNLGKIPLINSIYESLLIKAEVVIKDPTEQGLRKVLNFGHTIGHALEALSHSTTQPLLHGEAVSIGIIGELYLSTKILSLNSKILENSIELLQKYNLPIKFKFKNNFEDFYKIILNDKKNSNNIVKMVLLKDLEEPEIDVVVGVEDLKNTFNYLCKL